MFQSTHPHGVRPSVVPTSFFIAGFNPRTRMGCDKAMSRCTTLLWSLNPRTRMGCDWRWSFSPAEEESFNPRTRMGCDLVISVFYNMWAEFQSTHPHGVRQITQSGIHKAFSFNPRTRMGCDAYILQRCYLCISFNPRTRMGCDLKKLRTRRDVIMFQSTHPHGVRPNLASPELVVTIVSIHAPAWGATFITRFKSINK